VVSWPGATGPGAWRPVRTPAASLRLPRRDYSRV